MSSKFKPASPEELAERGVTPEPPANPAPALGSETEAGSDGETKEPKASARKTARKAA
jgi:hypothetical protein